MERKSMSGEKINKGRDEEGENRGGKQSAKDNLVKNGHSTTEALRNAAEKCEGRLLQ